MKLIIASKNKGKLKEITAVVGVITNNHYNIELLSLNDFPKIPDIPETGNTFEENAWLKAKTVYDKTGICTLADDSGLEVDYLNGRPGVYSARYAGENATDAENRQKLLHELKNVAKHNRTARFVCVMILYDGIKNNNAPLLRGGDGVGLIFKGVCEGTIAEAERGNNGFGYDSLFIPEGYSQTFAELEMETKNKISHRGKVLMELKKYLGSRS
jgi:non-canonical purine NTP pyrophosphatase (RdgB/HAM1 family)